MMKRYRYLIVALLCWACAATIAALAEDWQRVTAPGPSPRAAVGAKYKNGVIVVGGMLPTGYSEETWNWADGKWTIREPAPQSMGALWGSAIGTHEALGIILLVGGKGCRPCQVNSRNESWWYGAQGGPGYECGPPVVGRIEASLAWDPRRQVLVLYGGADHAKAYSEVWELDNYGSAWTKSSVFVPAGLGARNGHGAAWSEAEQAIVVFGGWRRGWPPLNGTFLYDGIKWRSAPLGAGNPPARVWPGMTSREGLLGGVVMFGGAVAPITPMLNDLWNYGPVNGVGPSIWRRIDTAHTPAGRCGPMVLAGLPDGVLLFGGQTTGGGVLGDCWILKSGATLGLWSDSPGTKMGINAEVLP